jgi:hypothetical protein
MALRHTDEKFVVDNKSNATSKTTTKGSNSPYSVTTPENSQKPSSRDQAARTPGVQDVRSGKHAKTVQQTETPRDPEHEAKLALKSNARAKLHGKPSRDRSAAAKSPTADADRQESVVSNSSGPVVASESQLPGKTPSRRVSFADRITRKIPFVKDSSDTRGSSPLLGNSPTYTGGMSPDSEMRTPRSSRSQRSENRHEEVPDRKPKFKPIDSHLLDGARMVLPGTLSPLASPLSSSPPRTKGQVVKTTAKPKVVTIREVSDRSINRHQPAAKELQAIEARTISTAPGSPKGSALRDLPLRHFRSSEHLPSSEQKGVELPAISRELRRTSSVQIYPPKKVTPPIGSSVYSPEAESTTAYEGLQSAALSTSYQSSGSSSAAPISAHPGAPTQASSVYSPEGSLGPASSAYIIPLSPYTSILTPPPMQSSATPSPLHISTKTETHQTPIPAPVKTTAEQPKSDIAPTALSSLQTDFSHRPSTPPEVLTSATVSGPEPDVYPYAYSHSDTDTPISKLNPPATLNGSDDKETISPPTFSPPTVSSFSPFPSPSTSAFPQNINQAPPPPPNLVLFPPISNTSGPSTLAIPATIDISKDDLDRGIKSPWKKVFGAGIGMNLGSKKGHRRSRSENQLVGIKVGVVDARPRSSGQKRTGNEKKVKSSKGGDGGHGFMGSGRDGVWISRKNFMKT